MAPVKLQTVLCLELPVWSVTSASVGSICKVLLVSTATRSSFGLPPSGGLPDSLAVVSVSSWLEFFCFSFPVIPTDLASSSPFFFWLWVHCSPGSVCSFVFDLLRSAQLLPQLGQTTSMARNLPTYYLHMKGYTNTT